MSRFVVLDTVVCLFALCCLLVGLMVRDWRDWRGEEQAAQADTVVELADVDEPPRLSVPLQGGELEPAEDWRTLVPLDADLVDALVDACDRYDVPVCLALGVMEQESRFVVDAFNRRSGCYGLMQLHPRYFPTGLAPAENIEAGVAYLGAMLSAYGDYGHAVTAYHDGPTSRVSSAYSDEVLARADAWEVKLREGRNGTEDI